MDLYISTQSSLRFIRDVVALLEEVGMAEFTKHNVKLVGQILEYVPIQTIAYLQRWLESNIDANNVSLINFRRILDELVRFPVIGDIISFTEKACSGIFRMSFTNSQVPIKSLSLQCFC